MKHSIEVGFSFGMTSGVITTLGLMVGLYSGTHSRIAVIGGVLTIAVADAFSDALGIHISEESEGVHSEKEIWASTVSTFLTKFLFALTFVIPILLFELATAVVVSIIYGLLVLSTLSFFLAKRGKAKPVTVIAEHLLIAGIVITATHYIGKWIALVFG